MRRRRLAAIIVPLTLTLASACAPVTTPQAAAPTSWSARRTAVTVPGDPYLRLARALHHNGVQVWFEADLVKAWLAGPQPMDQAVQRLGELARRTNVAGFKVADELGYQDGITTAHQGRAFLTAARRALARVAPGKPILVDVVVPDLGCLPWRGGPGTTCAERARRDYPAADEEAVASYLRARLIDRLDLSTGLLDDSTYAGWGTTLDTAQREAWQHVLAEGWAQLTRLQSRKALAAPGGYQGGASGAAKDLRTYVDLPLVGGAHAVDVWTWRQPYDGSEVSLLADDLRPNALWTGLRSRHDAGVALFTHMTPSAMPPGPAAFDHECAVAAQAFSAVFVAAGTG